MINPDLNGTADNNAPSPLDTSIWDHAKLREIFEKNIKRRECAVIDDEAAVLIRENLVTAREKAAYLRGTAADLRENAMDRREDNATSREQEKHTAETLQLASDKHIVILQQANAHLVVAILEAQELAEQVQMAKVQLQNAKVVAEKANLAKSDFLSSMSHELRTPLNAILGFAQLLEMGSPTPVQLARLHQITKAGWYLLDLINEILDLAIIESGKLSLSQEPVSLIEVMHECKAMMEPQAQQRSIVLNFIAFDNSWFANADRTRVKQVLINLLTNAIKYNCELGTVEVKCSATPERIRITIKDNGAGLSPTKMAQLFQPFNRLGQETGVEEGTGIGLVVTKQLVELMGGSIGVESEVDVGSEFWIELLRDHYTQQAGEQVIPAKLKPLAHHDKELRILLYVEDNPANLMLVEQIIEDHPQLRMLSARDGNQGVALAREYLPDIILMDINLPGISGIQALKILRKDPITEHIPIIALSANAIPRDIEKGLEAGFFRYLTKPIKINEFMIALTEALTFSEKAQPIPMKPDTRND